MTLLAPTALIGVLLLAIPIFVHLFKPRKMRRTPFSSLRWLKQTHQRLSRHIQWHQWLLFLMRAGVVSLLVLALAKPLIGSRNVGRPVDRYVILDAGRSMGYELGGVPTPLARAQEVAERLVDQTRPGERTALLLSGAAPRIVTGPVADAGRHLPTLRAAKAQDAERPLTSVLPLVRALAYPHAAERDLELVFLTDHRRGSWRPDDIQAFLKDWPGTVQVQVVDAGSGSMDNGWIAGVRLLDFGPGEDRYIRVELACSGDASQQRTLRLTGIRDLADNAQEVTVTREQITRVDFKVPSSLSLADQVAELRLEPADALAGDDRWFLNLDTVWGLRVLVIEPADRDVGRGPGLHVRAGLESLAESNNQALTITQRTSKTVASAEVREADLIVLAGVPELPEAIVEALEQRVRAGAGAVVLLGEGLNVPFYQQKLHRALQPAEGLLPAPLHAADPWRLAQSGTLTGLRWEHPLFAALRDPVLSDLQQVRFRKHAVWGGAPGPNAVLARIDDGEAALIEHPLGAGRVLLWNTSADDSWSDLPRRRSFVPLVDRMLSYLTGGGLRRDFVVGESATLPLSDAKPDDNVSVTAPSGAKLTPRVLSHAGQQFLHLQALPEAGAYRVVWNDKAMAFTANVNRAGSALAPMDNRALESWWAPATVQVVSVDTMLQQTATGRSWPLWPALIFLAGLLLMAETIYVHRLCPRSDPAVVESIVPKRGVLQPLHKEPG